MGIGGLQTRYSSKIYLAHDAHNPLRKLDIAFQQLIVETICTQLKRFI